MVKVVVVSVVVSNALHRQVAEDLVRAGKHVLCEKPLSDSLKNARAMAELEANSQVVTGVGFSYRLEGLVQALGKGSQRRGCDQGWGFRLGARPCSMSSMSIDTNKPKNACGESEVSLWLRARDAAVRVRFPFGFELGIRRG